MLSTNKLLLLGATGYIGGTVLDHLIACKQTPIDSLTFDVLVRQKDAADKLSKAYGERVNPILWDGFTDIQFVIKTAANYEIIINAGIGLIPEGAKALVDGLAKRIRPGCPLPWILHISGCTNLSDMPMTQTAYPDRKWDDRNATEVYEFLKASDEIDPYPQRTAELAVLTTAESTGVQAISVNTPCIFGTGTGLFNKQGFILSTFMRYILDHGYGFKLNDTATFDYVHVEDLADVFVLLVKTIVQRKDRGVGYLPSGKSGIISTAVRSTKLVEMMSLCLDAVFDAKLLPRADTPQEKKIAEVSLAEIARETTYGLLAPAERSWAGHKSFKGTVARDLLGWNPTRLEEAWKQDFRDILELLGHEKE